MIQVLTIKELEELSGVPRTTIHYYLRQGLLPRPQKSAASRSLYTQQHVELLREIADLKRAGLSIADIEAELRHRVDQANEATVDLAAQEYERLHNRILAVAAREFTSKGYKNTHVTAIMRRLGITATLFYSHFASKRKLLAECVNVAMQWSLAYADEQVATLEDPAERLLWDVFSHSHVFELGTSAVALIRLEGLQGDSELRRSLEEGVAGTVARILRELPVPAPPKNARAIREELIALSLFGAYEQTVFSAKTGDGYTREDLLRAHLWLFLAAQAAMSGEIDIDSRLVRYEKLISRLASEMPPVPSVFRE